MARAVGGTLDDGEINVNVQGFREGGGMPSYVYLEIEDDGGTYPVKLSVRTANILAEYIRQEAEFAGSPREEGK